MEKNKINENEIDQELHEHFSFDVDKGQEPLRIDKFLMNRIENATRNKIQNAAKDGYIRVNQNPVKSSYKVKKGDTLRSISNKIYKDDRNSYEIATINGI